MVNEVPEMNVAPPERGAGRMALSVVWLVPLLAVGIAVFIAWQTYSARGPLIEVSFESATGLEAGQTHLRFRSLDVGVVEDLKLDDDLSRVVAHIRLDKDVAPYVDEEAHFWIVQPEVSTSGVSGLDTVLSGVFIEGTWDATIGNPQDRFVGAEDPPLIPSGEEGIVIKLVGDEGGRVHGGAPVVYRGVTVGEIDDPVLEPDGSGVSANAFIRAPYDRLINSNSRFWGAGGVSFSVGADGLNVDVANLASLVQGGVTFGTVVSGGSPVADNATFTVYTDEEAARDSLFAEARADEVRLSTVFSGAVSGLTVGAPVELAGLRVGQVVDLGAFIAPEDPDEVQLRVDFSLRPGRLGLGPASDTDDVLTFISDAVSEGLHARLASAGLFSSELKIELVDADDRRPGSLDREGQPYPVLPALPVDLADLGAATEGIVDRLAALPVEDVMDNAVEFLDNLNRLIGRPEIQQLPEEVVGLLGATRTQVEAFDPAPLMAELQATATSLRDIVADIGSSENRGRIEAVLERTEALAISLETAAAGLPELLSTSEAVAQTVAAIDLAGLAETVSGAVAAVTDLATAPETRGLPAEVTGLVSETRSLLASTEVRALPGDLSATLQATETLMSRVQDSEGLATLLAALERFDRIAADIESTTDGLPALQAQVSGLVARADALPLEEVIASTQDVLDASAAFIGSDDTASVPGALTGALGEVEASLAELREGGSVENVNATLASAREASEALVAAAEALPELTDQLNGLVAQADALMAAYGDRSAFNAQTLATLHDLRAAAKAVTSLSRTIERNPSALIRGR